MSCRFPSLISLCCRAANPVPWPGRVGSICFSKLANSLAECGRIVPGKIQLGIGCVLSESLQQLVGAFIVIKEHKTLGAFD